MAVVWALLLTVLIQGQEASPRAPRSREDSVAVHVQQQLQAASVAPYENRALVGFYSRRAFRAAWSSEYGPNRVADDFVDAIGRADLDGLEPEDYHLSHIRALLDTVRNEYLLHRQIHEWFATGQSPRELRALNELVYAELFLTPSSDPWLGLIPSDSYAALPNNGVTQR